MRTQQEGVVYKPGTDSPRTESASTLSLDSVASRTVSISSHLWCCVRAPQPANMHTDQEEAGTKVLTLLLSAPLKQLIFTVNSMQNQLQ